MQENLHNMVTDVIKEIKNSVEKIDAAAMNLASSSRQQAAGAEEQSSSLTETSSTIEELASTSKQIADNVRTVAELAEKNLAGMDVVKTNTSYEANRILSLGEKSQSIGEVVAMIDEFARQTNLLALNASIEAARAGESGKGFEVVAVEIRKLATNVANSTKQIKDIIKEIQDATNASILATEKVGKSVEDGIKLSKLTAESVSHITMATQQQQSGSSQIVTAMKEMAIIAKQASTTATQINDIAEQLTTLTTDQKKLVLKFVIE
jgi:methyl-accepting chemotaxis protein